MKIYLYCDDQIYVFYLPEMKVGSYSFSPEDNDNTSKLINIEERDGEWVLFETEDSKVADASAFVSDVVLQENHFYMISREEKYYLIYVTDNDERCVKTFSYDSNLLLRIGDNNPTVAYRCDYVNDLSFEIRTEENKLVLEITKGKVYVNKLALKQNVYYIQCGDEIELYGAKLLFLPGILIIISADTVLEINPQLTRLVPIQLKSTEELKNIEVKDRNLYNEDDYFSKSPRIRRIIETKKIEFSQPPKTEMGGELPFLLTVGPMFTMAISSMMMLLNPISQLAAGTMDFSQAAPSLCMGGAMLLSALLWPLLSRIYNKRVKKKNMEKTLAKYNQYLAEKEKELADESIVQQEIIRENVISIDQCLDNLQHRSLHFWDKRVDQSDFLVVRIGIGDEKLDVEINYPEEGFTVEENDLKKQVEEMLHKYEYMKGVPIGYSLYDNMATAVMGDKKKTYPFVHNIIFQLLTFYSYVDLKLVVFTNNKNKSEWDYVKYLNHNMTNDNSFRFFASNEDSSIMVSDVLKQEISNRLSLLDNNKNGGPMFKPYYLIIVDDIDIVKRTKIIEELTELKANIGFSIIIMENKLSKLPSLCNNFINLADTTSGILRNSYERQEQQLFQDEINNSINMMEVAKILANIPVETSFDDNDEGSLPESITFLEMANVGKVEQLNVLNRWNTNDSTSNLKAEVGVGPDGNLMYLDLHEKAHGPHGLIAGMTGSGKSEFIITWILSLAMNFSPEDVAFILIDYKGGGLAFAFENQATGMRLPHLTGTITNLDKAEINRTLVSIDSEVKRRQRIFNEARDKLGESTIDIYKYQSFFHEGKLDEPLPHLFIVCDEFAELKAQQPDFMDNLISVARIGRSLGVHLILATQKPSGVVNDQIWSNTKFRVCLKVQDASDSKEMLKKPDAASLKQTGRFYLQVGYDEYFALGQSGWCGAKYYPSDVLQKTVDKSINILNEAGVTIKSIQAGTSKAKKAEAEGEQLAAVMKEIIGVATDTEKFARRLWLENIPGDITLEEMEEKHNFQYKKGKFDILLGEVDAPEKQEQYPLIYNLIEDGNTNIIGLDSQESEEMINTIFYNIMKHFSPEELSFYVIDYGSQNFLKYKNSQHCGGVVIPGDDESYNNLWKLLTEEMRERKNILSKYGREYSSYIADNPGKMPLMLVVLNNYASMKETDDKLFDFLGECLRDSERYGIVYLFTSTGLNVVQEKFRQLISNVLVFKLKDVSEYGYAFNNSRKKIEPRDLFGRGICKDDDLHEFQLAFVVKDLLQENEILLKVIDETKRIYSTTAKAIPSLPDQVMLEDVKKKLKGVNSVPVGIEKGTIAIKTLDLTVDVGKVILSSKIRYTRSFILNFITELLYLNVNMIVIDSLSLIIDKKSNITNYFVDDFDAKIDKVIDFIEKQSTKDTLVLIISACSLLDKLNDDKKLDLLFDKCKKMDNSHIVVFDEFKKIKSHNYDEWFKKIDVSEGLYIGPGVDVQNVFRLNNYSKEISQKLPSNFGYYISEGFYNVVKLIEFEKIEGEDEYEE